MSSLTEHVMSYIRYPMILPRQMAQLLMVPVVKQNKDFFVDKMATAMEYNLIKMGMSMKIYFLMLYVLLSILFFKKNCQILNIN